MSDRLLPSWIKGTFPQWLVVGLISLIIWFGNRFVTQIDLKFASLEADTRNLNEKSAKIQILEENVKDIKRDVQDIKRTVNRL